MVKRGTIILGAAVLVVLLWLGFWYLGSTASQDRDFSEDEAEFAAAVEKQNADIDLFRNANYEFSLYTQQVSEDEKIEKLS